MTKRIRNALSYTCDVAMATMSTVNEKDTPIVIKYGYVNYCHKERQRNVPGAKQ